MLDSFWQETQSFLSLISTIQSLILYLPLITNKKTGTTLEPVYLF